jgi:hypothetical protein
MNTLIGKRVTRWALRMALLWALKKGIEMANRHSRRPAASRSAKLQALH